MDDRGLALPTDPSRHRVISLVPSLTETVLAFGGRERLVGRTRYDKDPRIADVPSVGGTTNPDLEAILALEPDLVVLFADDDARGLPERLDDLGIPTYAAESRSMDDFRRHARGLGRLLGLTAAADSLVGWVDGELEAVRRRSPDLPSSARPGVLFILWPDPVLTTNGGTFVAEVVEAAGGRVIFDDLDQPWPRVSFETILYRDPDLVLLANGHARGQQVEWLLDEPRWKRLEAVRRGRVHTVDADLFTRPGPGMVRAAREVARRLRGLSGPVPRS